MVKVLGAYKRHAVPGQRCAHCFAPGSPPPPVVGGAATGHVHLCSRALSAGRVPGPLQPETRMLRTHQKAEAAHALLGEHGKGDAVASAATELGGGASSWARGSLFRESPLIQFVPQKFEIQLLILEKIKKIGFWLKRQALRT